jgi:hypothetical protein
MQNGSSWCSSLFRPSRNTEHAIHSASTRTRSPAACQVIILPYVRPDADLDKNATVVISIQQFSLIISALIFSIRPAFSAKKSAKQLAAGQRCSCSGRLFPRIGSWHQCLEVLISSFCFFKFPSYHGQTLCDDLYRRSLPLMIRKMFFQPDTDPDSGSTTIHGPIICSARIRHLETNLDSYRYQPLPTCEALRLLLIFRDGRGPRQLRMNT